MDYCPTDDSHNHDDIYTRSLEIDCVVNSGRATIVGTPPSDVCSDCDAIAGYAVSTDPDQSPILEIVGLEKGGIAPFPDPQVTSVVVTDDKVTVTWWPTDNEASITLGEISAAVANDPQAAALIRVAVCDCSAFSSFSSGELDTEKPITDVPSDGVKYIRRNKGWLPADVQNPTPSAIAVIEGTADIPTQESFGLQTRSPVMDATGTIKVIPGLGDTHDQTLAAGVLGLDDTGALVRHDGVTEGGVYVEPISFVAKWTPTEFANQDAKIIASIPVRAGWDTPGGVMGLQGFIRKATIQGGFSMAFKFENAIGDGSALGGQTFGIGDTEAQITYYIDMLGQFVDFSPPQQEMYWDTMGGHFSKSAGGQAGRVYYNTVGAAPTGPSTFKVDDGSYDNVKTYTGEMSYMSLYATPTALVVNTEDQILIGKLHPTYYGVL